MLKYRPASMIVTGVAVTCLLLGLHAFLKEHDDKKSKENLAMNRMPSNDEKEGTQGVALQNGSSTTRNTTTSPPSEVIYGLEKAGEKYGDPLNTGFVFINGRYIDTPYVVSRRGVHVFVNDQQIDWDHFWPTYPTFDVTVDPGPVPKSVTKNTTYEDYTKTEYARHKGLYLNYKYHRIHGYPKEKAFLMKVEHIRSLPMMKAVEVLSMASGEIRVHTYPGENFDVDTGYNPKENGSDLYQNPYSGMCKDSYFQKEMEEWRLSVEDSLKRGGTIIAYHPTCIKEAFSHATLVDEDMSVRWLPVIIKVLRSNLPIKEKLSLLSSTTLTSATGNLEPVPQMIVDYVDSPKLMKRLDELMATSKESPIFLDELRAKAVQHHKEDRKLIDKVNIALKTIHDLKENKNKAGK